jgi:TrmH family RNA methyltransferase
MTPPAKFDDRLRRIDSRQNARVKELRRAFAEATPNEQGEIAVEGMHLVEEAMRSGLRLGAVFFSESGRQRAHKLLPQLSSHAETLLLPDEVFASAVPSETPQGVAALVRVKSFNFKDVLIAQPVLLVITAGLQDPGNLGTIARSAEAFGVELEGSAGLGGIVVSSADGESRTGGSTAADQSSGSASAGHVVT